MAGRLAINSDCMLKIKSTPIPFTSKHLKYPGFTNPGFRFFFWLILFACLYQYPSILLKRPQSVHHWRQADCASITLNYYQNGMHFFQPQTHNLTSDQNTTGYCAPSELPLEYYFIAVLYKIFGYHDLIYRLVNTLIFLTGLFYLFKTALLLLKDNFWALFIALLFFTSPVLVYYGNNFLTDSSGLAFSLMGWYFFIKYYLLKTEKSFYISMLFFLVAGSCKISALISVASLFIIFLMETMRLFRSGKEESIFRKPFASLFAFLFLGGVISSWIYYAKWYNLLHNSGYFTTTIFPVWDMEKDKIALVLNRVKDLWLNEYFHVSTLYFFLAAFITNLVLIKRSNYLLAAVNLLLFVGSTLYAVLWFETFVNHDYYLINSYILLVFTLLNFAWIIKDRFPLIFSSVYLKLLLFGFLVFNLFHAKERVRLRYDGWWSEQAEYKDYNEIIPYLRSIGIDRKDPVICLPDETHFTLYLMNQPGWTQCLGENTDSVKISNSIHNGAKYLIINGDEILKRDYLQSFLKDPIGQFNVVKIFRLKI